MADERDIFESELQKWLSAVDVRAKQVIPSLTSGNSTGKLARGFKGSIKRVGGIPDRLTFRFSRYGIFFHYGVGRGQSISNQESGRRKASSWYSKVVTEQAIAELQEIIARYDQNLVINAFKI